MKFKYACYIEISEESRKHLELLGYDLLFSARNELADLLLASQCGIAVAAIACNIPDDAINCMGNLDLFKAVSAMREDKIESEQYYVLDQEKGYVDENGEVIITHPKGTFIRNPLSTFISFIGHKATLTELQEQFKEKKV